jgi:hypothetical protein
VVISFVGTRHVLRPQYRYSTSSSPIIKFMHGLEGRQSAQANESTPINAIGTYLYGCSRIIHSSGFVAFVSVPSVRDRFIGVISSDMFERLGATDRLVALTSDVIGMYQPACRKLRTSDNCQLIVKDSLDSSVSLFVAMAFRIS